MEQFRIIKNKINLYIKSSLGHDFFAAITVAMIAVPQAMAYAVIAGVNPVYGLYSAIIPAIVACVFGSSNQVVTGPTNTIALATSGVLVAVLAKGNYPEFVFAIAILSGVIRLLLGMFKLGTLIRYVSNAVLTGFLAGAAVLIILNQLHKIMGVSSPVGHNLLEIASHIIRNITSTNMLVLVLGTTSILLLLAAKHFWPKLPSAMILVIVSSLLVQFYGWEENGVQVIGEIGQVGIAGMRFHIPEILWIGEYTGLLLNGAGAVALLSLLETVSVAKTIAMKTDQRIDVNREFIGQGLASIIGGFFRGIPTSGSLTRSAVNFGNGAVTRAASGISGLLVLIVLVVLKNWVGYIPIVSLGGIVIVSALRMIDFHHIAITWRGRLVSKTVIAVTFLAVLLLPLQISIYLGTGLSIIFYLIESSHLNLSYLILNGNDKFTELKIDEVYQKKPEVAVINIEGPLYFAAVQDLEDQITRMIEVGVKVIVLRLRRMHLMASSGISTLELLIRRAKKRGVEIRLAGVSQEVTDTLSGCGLECVIGEENIFKATEIPYEATRRAIE